MCIHSETCFMLCGSASDLKIQWVAGGEKQQQQKTKTPKKEEERYFQPTGNNCWKIIARDFSLTESCRAALFWKCAEWWWWQLYWNIFAKTDEKCVAACFKCMSTDIHYNFTLDWLWRQMMLSIEGPPKSIKLWNLSSAFFSYFTISEKKKIEF